MESDANGNIIRNLANPPVFVKLLRRKPRCTHDVARSAPDRPECFCENCVAAVSRDDYI